MWLDARAHQVKTATFIYPHGHRQPRDPPRPVGKTPGLDWHTPGPAIFTCQPAVQLAGREEILSPCLFWTAGWTSPVNLLYNSSWMPRVFCHTVQVVSKFTPYDKLCSHHIGRGLLNSAILFKSTVHVYGHPGVYVHLVYTVYSSRTFVSNLAKIRTFCKYLNMEYPLVASTFCLLVHYATTVQFRVLYNSWRDKCLHVRKWNKQNRYMYVIRFTYWIMGLSNMRV